LAPATRSRSGCWRGGKKNPEQRHIGPRQIPHPFGYTDLRESWARTIGWRGRVFVRVGPPFLSSGRAFSFLFSGAGNTVERDPEFSTYLHEAWQAWESCNGLWPRKTAPAGQDIHRDHSEQGNAVCNSLLFLAEA